MTTPDRTNPAPTHARYPQQGIDVSGNTPAIDLVAYVDAYIDGTSPTGLPRNALFDYIDTLTDTQRADVCADMVAEVARLLDDEHTTPTRLDDHNEAEAEIHPSQADQNKNTLAELAVDDVMDTVDAADDWAPTGPDDPHLEFGNRWVTYLVTARVFTGRQLPPSALEAFDPDLCWDDCTGGLRDIRNYLINTEPNERGRYVAGMFCALNLHFPTPAAHPRRNAAPDV